MRKLRSYGGVGAALVCLAAANCSSKSDGSPAESTVTQGASGATSPASAAPPTSTVSGGPSLNVGKAAAGGTGTANATLPDGEVCGTACSAGQAVCAPEICDGIDNNCDGAIDNIDKNGDGVCDCILVATLGVPGKSGQGDVFSTWLSTRSNNGATSLGDQVLTPALLAMYEVIVAEDVHMNHPYSPTEVQALDAWVRNGGGFMTLTGYSTMNTEVSNVNTLLQVFGMDYNSMQILSRVRGGTTVPITQWVAHPVDLGVQAVGIDNGYPVEGVGTMFSMGGGYNVGEALVVGKGHVLLWGDEWITYDSEWTAHPDYQVQLFWLNAIKWLTVAGTCQIPIPPSLGGVK